MYIKIKHIKQFLLIAACIFFAGFNYLTYVNADNASNVAITDFDKDGLTDAEEKLYGTDAKKGDSDGDGYSDGVEVKSGYDPTKPAPGDKIAVDKNNNPSLASANASNVSSMTDTYMQEFKQFVATKEGQSVSSADVKEFSETSLAGKVNTVTIESLPSLDESLIKKMSQSYVELSEGERQQRLQQDAIRYLYQIVYILVSNAPTPVTTSEELAVFQKDFEKRLADFATTENAAYFSDLGDRLEIVSKQLGDMEVPETMLALHMKFSRIIAGFLSLRDLPRVNSSDPVGNIVTLNKAMSLAAIFSDFLTTDFSDYFKQISAI